MAFRVRYVEVAPPAALAQWLLTFWEMRFTAQPNAPARLRVLPDGSADIVIYMGGAAVGEAEAAVVGPRHRAYVVGTRLRSFMVRCAGHEHVIGAAIRPAGVLPLLGFPAADLGGRIYAMAHVLGAEGRALEDRVVTGAPHGALDRFAAALLERLRHVRAPDPLTQRAEELIRAGKGRRPIGAVADALGTSPRHLERRFAATVGMTPKVFSRLIRFDRVIRELAHGQPSWSHLALEHGFSDQAHLINEIRAFAGVPPTVLEAEQRSLERPPEASDPA